MRVQQYNNVYYKQITKYKSKEEFYEKNHDFLEQSFIKCKKELEFTSEKMFGYQLIRRANSTFEEEKSYY
eukprot:CAMPEP_0170556984 /NCGR_PEP_ID=MMETSP0211-20121228/19102_1 /TAXON_ID=311385 /ORGANISM="Pseudokeronopsis sp., Strain OXSARD2" /LENGTH=69 /DNA_ID=CAMNT_0010867637 /DNA_START=789 /DNA_END=998 /DNA_ORIENTATION=-